MMLHGKTVHIQEADWGVNDTLAATMHALWAGGNSPGALAFRRDMFLKADFAELQE